LIHDRELALFDGRRLLRHDRYDAIKMQNNLSVDDMKDKYVIFCWLPCRGYTQQFPHLRCCPSFSDE